MAMWQAGLWASLPRLAVALLSVTGIGATAAPPGSWVDAIIPLPAQAEPESIPLAADGVCVGTAQPEAWAQQTSDQRLIYNVARPVLIPVPNAAARANAPAIILVPGGGFEFLAIDNEGYDIARRLTPLGVRVFILKYRTLAISGGFGGFKDAVVQTFVKGSPAGSLEADIPCARADTQAAIRMVRAHAQVWHIDASRVGVVGFSAGAMTVLATLQADASDARPDFAAMIYGPTQGVPVPQHPRPLFAAIAADDRFFGKQDLGLIHAWRQAGGSVELHLYSGGGHGFASHPNHTTSDAWFDQFSLWLKTLGYTGRR